MLLIGFILGIIVSKLLFKKQPIPTLTPYESEEATILIGAIEKTPDATALYKQLLKHFVIIINNRGLIPDDAVHTIQRPLGSTMYFDDVHGWTQEANMWNDFTTQSWGLTGGVKGDYIAPHKVASTNHESNSRP